MQRKMGWYLRKSLVYHSLLFFYGEVKKVRNEIFFKISNILLFYLDAKNIACSLFCCVRHSTFCEWRVLFTLFFNNLKLNSTIFIISNINDSSYKTTLINLSDTDNITFVGKHLTSSLWLNVPRSQPYLKYFVFYVFHLLLMVSFECL